MPKREPELPALAVHEQTSFWVPVKMDLVTEGCVFWGCKWCFWCKKENFVFAAVHVEKVRKGSSKKMVLGWEMERLKEKREWFPWLNWRDWKWRGNSRKKEERLGLVFVFTLPFECLFTWVACIFLLFWLVVWVLKVDNKRLSAMETNKGILGNTGKQNPSKFEARRNCNYSWREIFYGFMYLFLRKDKIIFWLSSHFVFRIEFLICVL